MACYGLLKVLKEERNYCIGEYQSLGECKGSIKYGKIGDSDRR